jgi:hypothetical protein
MYELLLRTETLLMGLQPPVMLGVGAVALVIGLVFWLGGTRHSTGIVGLLGAVIGAGVGLLVGQQFSLHPWLSMLVGAVVVAVLAILLKKAMILALAVLILSAVSGAGYVSVVLDHMAPPPAPTPTSDPAAQQTVVYQSFLRMEPEARLSYVNKISQESQTFTDRFKALLADTWAGIQPHKWMALIAIIAGAVVAVVLVWFIAKIVIALAYSIVGVAAIFLGLQAALLSVNVRATSQLYPRPWLLPAIFLVMVAIGWLWQLLFQPVKVKREVKEAREEPDAA